MDVQLAISTGLVVVASFSALAKVLLRHKEGEIKLPLSQNADTAALEHDPFDVATPEDVIDGYPLDEEDFWIKVRKT